MNNFWKTVLITLAFGVIWYAGALLLKADDPFTDSIPGSVFVFLGCCIYFSKKSHYSEEEKTKKRIVVQLPVEKSTGTSEQMAERPYVEKHLHGKFEIFHRRKKETAEVERN